MLVGNTHDLPRIRHATQNVRHMRHRNEARSFAESRFISLHVERTIFVQRHPFKDCTITFPKEMPGNDIGVVLHDGENNLIARLDVFRDPAGDQIDTFRRAARENDLFHARGIEEAPYIFAGVFHCRCRLIGERVEATVHIGIGRAHLVGQSRDNRLRLLRRSGTVQIDERLSIHLT